MKIKYTIFLNKYFIKHKSFILFLLCLVTFVYYLFCYESAYNKDFKVIKNQEKNIPIFHMGFGNEAPISSLLATKKAINAGAKILDMDVWLTKDSEVVVFHDKDLSKNTNGKGLIYESDSKYLNTLLIQSNKFIEKESIHLLKDHLEQIKNNSDILLFIEIKEIDKTRLELVLDKINLLSEEYKLKDRIIIFNRDPFNVCVINNKNIPSGFNFVDEGYYNTIINKYGKSELSNNGYYNLSFYKKNIYFQRLVRKFCQPDIIAINKNVSENIYLKIKEAKYQFIIWSLNTKIEIEKAILKNPEGIVTDGPKILIKILK